MWPNYSAACRKDVDALLRAGGSLSAYRANPQVGVEPAKDSWAWRLERDAEKRFGVRHAVAVNSGTAALHAALSTLSLRGGGVITSPYTFSATASAILLAGGTPVFADVDPYTFNITKETVKRVLTKKTKAILPVSLFGGLSDLAGLREYGLPMVADDCQAVGARGGYRRTAYCEGAAFSFNGGKQVPAGECGMLVTDSERVAGRARYLMNHGENFGQKSVGYNYRPNEVTCCIAWHGLKELEYRNGRRQYLAGRLNAVRHLDLVRAGIGRTFPNKDDETHAYYVYPFTLAERFPISRALFSKRMRRMGVPVGEGYITPPLHKYPAFRKYQTVPLPVVEELSSKTLCILSTLTPDRPLSYADHVADCMRKALK